MRASGAKCELRLQSSTVIFCNSELSNSTNVTTSYVAMLNDTSKLYGASERISVSSGADEASRGSNNPQFSVNRTVIDTSSQQAPFKFDFSQSFTDTEERLRDVQIAKNNQTLLAMTFDRHIEVHDINLTSGTSVLESVNISSLLNKTMLDQISGLKSSLVHRTGDFQYLHVTFEKFSGDI